MAIVKYPTLISEMSKRKITKKAVAQCLGICEKALHNKLKGESEFTWPETSAIRDTFFPDMNKDTLFAKSDDRNSA